MPPRPIDSRNVYQKTLYAQQEAEKLHEGLEKDKQLRHQFMTKEREREQKNLVQIADERVPTRHLEREAHREQRKKNKQKKKQDNESTPTETEEEIEELRKRLPEDDIDKGERLDITG